MQLPAQFLWCALKYCLMLYSLSWVCLTSDSGCNISALFRSAVALSGSDKYVRSTGRLAVLRCISPRRDPHVKATLQVLPSGRRIKQVLPQLDMDDEPAGTAKNLTLGEILPSGHYPHHPIEVDKDSPSGHHPGPLIANMISPSGHHPARLLADRNLPSEPYVPTAVADRDARWVKQCGLCDMLRMPCLQSSCAAMSCTLFSWLQCVIWSLPNRYTLRDIPTSWQLHGQRHSSA